MSNQKVFYNKLVRDRMPEVVERNGDDAEFRQMSEDEYGFYLDLKLKEEVSEYLKEPSVEELADIQEVLYAIAYHRFGGIKPLHDAQRKKRISRGSFGDRLCMIWAEFKK